MAKFPTELKWSFDPRTNPFHPVLSIEAGRIVWGGIKTQHIVDQYFNDSCQSFVKAVLEAKPKDAKELYVHAQHHLLGAYGTKENPNNRGGMFEWHPRVPDYDFWQAMLDAITGKVPVKMVYPETKA